MIISQKIPGGKLVTLDVEFDHHKIKKIKITGDFFLHPEDTIEKIENYLTGARTNEVASRITEILKQNQAQFIGVKADDIERMVVKVVS